MIIVQHQDPILGYRGREKRQMIFSHVLLMKKIKLKKYIYYYFINLFILCVCLFPGGGPNIKFADSSDVILYLLYLLLGRNLYLQPVIYHAHHQHKQTDAI